MLVTGPYHGFSEWLRFGGEVIGRNDPDHQEKIVKFNELLANCVIYQNACDITAAANALAADGHPSTPTTWPPSRPTSPRPSAGSATGSSTCPYPKPPQ